MRESKLFWPLFFFSIPIFFVMSLKRKCIIGLRQEIEMVKRSIVMNDSLCDRKMRVEIRLTFTQTNIFFYILGGMLYAASVGHLGRSGPLGGLERLPLALPAGTMPHPGGCRRVQTHTKPSSTWLSLNFDQRRRNS